MSEVDLRARRGAPRRVPGMAVVLLGVGCTRGALMSEADKGGDGPVIETGTPVDADSGDTASETAITDFPTSVDCAAVPEMPLKPTRLAAPSGYNDLVFDADGGMIGGDGNHLWRATSPDSAEVFAPGVGRVYKLGMLPSGDIVATTSSKTVILVTPDGVSTPIVTDLDGYGLAVGSDGLLYVGTDYNARDPFIARIDPTTGEVIRYIEAADYPPRALDFSRDFSRLYFGTVDDGHVYAVDLDEDLDPIGAPQLLVTLPGGWHDTLEVDACGNLYVGGFFGWTIYRVSAEDLSITALMSWNFDNYGHGFEWGGAGTWDPFAIYVTHPYNGTWVDEHVLGVPGRAWGGEVIGGRTL